MNILLMHLTETKQMLGNFLMKMGSVIGVLFITCLSHNAVCEEKLNEVMTPNSWAKDPNGCLLDGEFYPVGEMEAMNRKEIENREHEGEYVSDGEAIMMQCTYLVDTEKSDHPEVGKREYTWVAFSWTTF